MELSDLWSIQVQPSLCCTSPAPQARQETVWAGLCCAFPWSLASGEKKDNMMTFHEAKYIQSQKLFLTLRQCPFIVLFFYFFWY